MSIMIIAKDSDGAPDISRNTVALGAYDIKHLKNKTKQKTLINGINQTHPHGHPAPPIHTGARARTHSRAILD